LKENDMYAIVTHGGHQLKVSKGAKITVNRLAGEVGSSVELAQVLLLSDGSQTTVGTPTVAGAKVTAKILAHSQGDKVIIFKKRRRQNSRRKNGFRASLTTLEITGVSAK
jgi:large subunit ribosomal protein L21